jgi:formylglycine-generating enzyme required for sulfatase activity
MRFVLIPAGHFWMGSPRTLSNETDEQPRRLVHLTRSFFLGTFPVTQRQYQSVRRRNPSAFSSKGVFAARVANLDTSHWPVESVSYVDIERFLEALNRRPDEQAARRSYRLPTEAEWEYACRAGICHTAYTFGRSLRPTDARFDRENDSPMPVGSYRPNLFGLYDMHGNVWEWTADWYDAGYYAQAPREDPTGPPTGHRRVLRGGGWSTPSHLCRSALRGHNNIHARHDYNGFRVAFSVEKGDEGIRRCR